MGKREAEVSEQEKDLTDHCFIEDDRNSQTKECGPSLKAERGQETDYALELPERNVAVLTVVF